MIDSFNKGEKRKMGMTVNERGGNDVLCGSATLVKFTGFHVMEHIKWKIKNKYKT